MVISIPEESSEAVKITIKKEIQRLKEKVQALKEQLTIYEKKYRFSSEEFHQKFEKGELGDDQIFFEWYADLETFHRVKKRLSLLEKVKLD